MTKSGWITSAQRVKIFISHQKVDAGIQGEKYIKVIGKLHHRYHTTGVFLRCRVLKICYKFCNQHGCPPVNLLHIFRTAFSKNNFVWFLLISWIIHKTYKNQAKSVWSWSNLCTGLTDYGGNITPDCDEWLK